MITITLPDGAKRELPDNATPGDLAENISKSLAKKVVIAKVDGKDWDLTRPIGGDAKVELVMRDSADGLEVIRHDTAHILAQAVQELFPGTQVTIGPSIEDGFYYDFARDEPFSTDDFGAIEKRMAEIVDRDLPFVREEWDRNEAIAHFEKMGEKYKAELIRDLPEDEVITIYSQGDWIDLCRGPHLPSTGKIGKSFKLMKVAGAYWRGDHRNAMLQRIYGTAWANDAQLAEHLNRIEEAEKRDHRKLGKAMDLFHMQEEARGMVFWHDKGWTLWRALENYVRRRLQATGYQEVKTPTVIDRSLWEKSGHWEKFQEHMFTSQTEDGDVHCLKPMNCPAHVQIFNHGQTSYRDLPLRMAEFGSCHRYEPSGALHGLMRVRGFVQDDAHIFCTPDQVADEVKGCIDLINLIYADLGFTNVTVKFSDRPETRAGSDEIWDKAEADLLAATKAAGVEVVHNPGEGAFYGPKLEFVLRDAIGRDWQCGTVQLDFVLPERLGADYVGEDGNKHQPAMIHRAILGSFERFVGILIENYAGKFPLWLAPTQVVVATITSEADEYGAHVEKALNAAGIRVKPDFRNEKINYKVREHSLAKIPVIAVVGMKEAEQRTVALRFLGSEDRRQEVLSLDEAISRLVDDATPPDLKRQ